MFRLGEIALGGAHVDPEHFSDLLMGEFLEHVQVEPRPLGGCQLLHGIDDVRRPVFHHIIFGDVC